MQTIFDAIKHLFTSYSSDQAERIEKLPQSGSNRTYFRLFTPDCSYIVTHGNNIAENLTFIRFSRHFCSVHCPVPQIYAVSEDLTIYIQQDFGDLSLLHVLEHEGYTAKVFDLFCRSLKALAHLQIQGGKNLDYHWCLTSKEFGKQAILSDLLYFKYYFLDTLQIPYDKEKLIEDFDALSTYLSLADHKHFMFRDFQSRNILLVDEEPKFIDFQGGMRGALQYDVASMLWQAKAELPDDWKNRLLQYYMDCVEHMLHGPINRARFESQYYGYVLIRLLQVLGAYGFRGLFERKAHFLVSIPLALRNLRWFVVHKDMGIALPEFERLLRLVVEDELISRFEPLRANENTPLVVRIVSFSYKNGIPDDSTGNAGGFVFDCRGILNPGRLEQFKKKTGRDKEVKDYLEQETKMLEFLNSIYDLVDLTVTDYLERGFSDLMVCFGCTGGQHRSVYAADALVRHLTNKFRVKVKLSHLVQETKNWVNE